MLFSVKPCRMDYISTDQEIRRDDEVVTSGLGGVYPEGIVLGHVTRVEVDPSGLYQRADIVPKANLGGLRYVFVVKK